MYWPPPRLGGRHRSSSESSRDSPAVHDQEAARNLTFLHHPLPHWLAREIGFLLVLELWPCSLPPSWHTETKRIQTSQNSRRDKRFVQTTTTTTTAAAASDWTNTTKQKHATKIEQREIKNKQSKRRGIDSLSSSSKQIVENAALPILLSSSCTSYIQPK